MLEWLMRINCKFFGISYTGSNPVYPIKMNAKIQSKYYYIYKYINFQYERPFLFSKYGKPQNMKVESIGLLVLLQTNQFFEYLEKITFLLKFVPLIQLEVIDNPNLTFLSNLSQFSLFGQSFTSKVLILPKNLLLNKI